MATDLAGAVAPPGRWRPADAFVALNLAAFLIMGAVFALDRNRHYGSSANIPEFFVYACVIAAILALVWPKIRRFDFPFGLFLLVEAGIVAHFCGGFVQVGGARLYDQTMLGIGYDNLVHGLNAFAGAAVIDHLLRQYHFGPALWHWLVLGLVLGAGAATEIVEYAVLQIVPTAGIGGYDNNARDLVSNLVGALAFLPFIRPPESA
jgi:uncharacterized membrane protein YjdF